MSAHPSELLLVYCAGCGTAIGYSACCGEALVDYRHKNCLEAMYAKGYRAGEEAMNPKLRQLICAARAAAHVVADAVERGHALEWEHDTLYQLIQAMEAFDATPTAERAIK